MDMFFDKGVWQGHLQDRIKSPKSPAWMIYVVFIVPYPVEQVPLLRSQYRVHYSQCAYA